MSRLGLGAVVTGLFLAACVRTTPPIGDQPVTLGGSSVSAEILRQGQKTYTRYCQACHGPKGDGLGPMGPHQRPPARDLTLGIIKYASVPSGQLPTDQDLERVIRRGVPGTAMLPWNVPDQDIRPLIQYVKFLSPRWRTGRPGTPTPIGTDPWAGPSPQAIERGLLLFHGQASCIRCHPSPLDKPSADKLQRDLGPERTASWREDLHSAAVTDSAHGPIRATRLGTDPWRNGDRAEDIYRVIANGVGGTAMPTWYGALSDSDLWALAHYVRSLAGADTSG